MLFLGTVIGYNESHCYPLLNGLDKIGRQVGHSRGPIDELTRPPATPPLPSIPA